MSKVAVVTDSNSGITQAQSKELGIEVLPMPFMIDGETFYEEITLSRNDKKVHVVNNQRISVTQRQSVLDAIALVRAGKSGSEIKNILEADKFNSSIYIMIDTLYYLKKGGRITPAAAALARCLC